MENVLLRKRNILLPTKKRKLAPGGSRNFIESVADEYDEDIAGGTMSGAPQKGKGFMSKLGGNGDKVSAAADGVMAITQSVVDGANNIDKGKHEETMNAMQNNRLEAENNMNQSYSAGQELNLMGRGVGANSAKDLKAHKGWKNILGATAAGATAGLTIGGPWGAAIGGAVGLIGSSIGEIFGAKKRRKAEREERERKADQDYAIKEYNQRQASLLESANENANKVTAEENRTSVLGLMAYGGRRKNYLINNRRRVIC